MSEFDLSPEALKQRKFLAECTNGGEWTVSLENPFSIFTSQENWLIGVIHSYNDAAHIAANSPQAVLSMIAEIEGLRAEVAKLEKEANWLADKIRECRKFPDPCGPLWEEGDCILCWRKAARKAVEENQ